MIVSAILYIVGSVLAIFLGVLSVIVAPLQIIMPDLPTNLGNIFGNVYLFDTFLPVTELFYFAILAITFKTAILGYKVFLLTTHFFGYVKRTFLTYSS